MPSFSCIPPGDLLRWVERRQGLNRLLDGGTKVHARESVDTHEDGATFVPTSANLAGVGIHATRGTVPTRSRRYRRLAATI